MKIELFGITFDDTRENILASYRDFLKDLEEDSRMMASEKKGE